MLPMLILYLAIMTDDYHLGSTKKLCHFRKLPKKKPVRKMKIFICKNKLIYLKNVLRSLFSHRKYSLKRAKIITLDNAHVNMFVIDDESIGLAYSGNVATTSKNKQE